MEYKEIGQHINLIAICISAFKCYRKHWEISEGLIFGFAIWLALNSIKWFWFDISEKKKFSLWFSASFISIGQSFEIGMGLSNLQVIVI